MRKLLLFILMIVCLQTRAQFNSGVNVDHFDHGYGITLSTDYDAPVGNWAYTFKPALAYGLNLIKFDDNFTINAGIGYQVFKPKLDTFYYRVDASSYGTAVYHNYSALSAYLGFAYNFRATDQLWLYAGLNLGAYFTKYHSESSDKYIDETDDYNEKQAYAAPKAGITYAISDALLISYQARYNIFSPVGNSAYSDRVGTVYRSVSNGITLTYKFSL